MTSQRLGIFTLLLVGAVVTMAAGASEDTAAATAVGVTVRVVDAETLEPLSHATVELIDNAEKLTAITDASGECIIMLPKPPKERLCFHATLKGYVRDSACAKPAGLESPKRPVTVRLTKGVPVGGVIVDEAGAPVEGVSVSISLQTRSAYVETITNGDGRWELAVPKEETAPAWQLQHPEFPLTTTYSWITITDELRELRHRHVIERGVRIEGSIVDKSDAPVRGAFVMRGFVDFDTYDALNERITSGEIQNVAVSGQDGRFAIPVEQQTTALIVCARDFAPALLPVKRDGSSHRVVLTQGISATGRVRGADGQPLEGVAVNCYQWKPDSRNTLMMRPYGVETDSNGVFTMSCLPETGCLNMDADKKGYFGTGVDDAAPGALPEEFILYPSAPLQGRVYDADTKKPVKAFWVDYGFSKVATPVKSTYCHEPFRKYSEEGRFSIDTGASLSSKPGAVWVRVWALDHYPVLVDPVWATEFASKPLDVALEPADPILGNVRTPSGEPAKDASIAVVFEDETAIVEGRVLGTRYVGAPYLMATSTDSGSFRLPPAKAPALILALHESGWKVVRLADYRSGEDMTLVPWSTLEGQVSMDDRPDTERGSVYAQCLPQEEWGGKDRISFSLSTPIDAEGRFRIENVPALPMKVGESRRWVMSHAKDLIPTAGETVQVALGVEKGGAVRGHVVVNAVVDPEGCFTEPWHANRRFLIAARPKDASQDDEFANYIPLLKEDGAFLLDRLPPGDYELTATAHEQPPDNACGRGTPRARVSRTFTIAADPSKELDLGELRLEPIATIDAGIAAPEIDGASLSGDKSWKLTAERAHGKPILLVFWATWCVPCRDEISLLKDLWKDYGEGEQLRIVGLNLDWDLKRAAAFVSDAELPWPQYNIGAWKEDNPVTNAYGIAYIPSNWLLAPDGRVLAARIPGKTLKETIAAHVRAKCP